MSHSPDAYRLIGSLNRKGRAANHVSLRHVRASRHPETVTAVSLPEVSDCLSRCDWSACDDASALFQSRWSRTDGGILNDAGYHSFSLIIFQDTERIEFIGPDGRLVSLFAEGGAFPYPWGMGAWLDEFGHTEEMDPPNVVHTDLF